MKREAVQEERQKHKDRNEPQSPQSNSNNDLKEDSPSNQVLSPFEAEDSMLTQSEKSFLDKLIESENLFFPKIDNLDETVRNISSFFCLAFKLAWACVLFNKYFVRLSRNAPLNCCANPLKFRLGICLCGPNLYRNSTSLIWMIKYAY